MDAYVVFYLVFGLLLTSENSFCLRKERTKREWTDVAEADFPYLALVECGDPLVSCSGTITSKSAVLSYCSCTETGTTASAGLIKKATRNDNTQKRDVTAVAAHADLAELKVYSLNKEWDWTKHVGSIALRQNQTRGKSAETCKVVGFHSGTARVLDQKIGESTECGLTATAGVLYSAAVAGELFTAEQHGGPAVCGAQLWGVIKEGKKAGEVEEAAVTVPEKPTTDRRKKRSRHTSRTAADCNLYVDVAYYSDWIHEKSGAASIRCSSKKISVFQVLVAPILVTILQYFSWMNI